MGFHTRVVRSLSYNSWHNQALEAWLLDQVGEDEVILYLWQNQHTVFIGRHQNPWKECRCEELEATGGRLCRRLSGGGAVYHDLGNLNFTFVLKKKHYDLRRQSSVILEAVKSLGINAEFTGRNDMTVDGRKFSGNAFYHGKNGSYHHGTVMIGIDPEQLTKYLQVSKEKMAAKGVDSVRSRTVNLNTLRPSLTVEEMAVALEKSFAAIYGKPAAYDTFNGTDTFDGWYEKFSSREWQYGHTPQFDITYQTRFPWGGIELGLTVENATISSATIFSDAMNATLISELADGMRGLPFNLDAIAQWLGSFPAAEEDRPAVDDLKAWLLAKSGEARG
ncbi:MAG: lipoate--protein ligase [Mycobacterium leprae]